MGPLKLLEEISTVMTVISRHHVIIITLHIPTWDESHSMMKPVTHPILLGEKFLSLYHFITFGQLPTSKLLIIFGTKFKWIVQNKTSATDISISVRHNLVNPKIYLNERTIWTDRQGSVITSEMLSQANSMNETNNHAA